MEPKLRVQSVNCVLRGEFQPRKTPPSWLYAQGLIRREEAAAAKIGVISEQITQFDTASFRLAITTDRFQIATTEPACYGALRDLIAGIFSLLDETPINVLGINRDYHYELHDRQAWNAVGNQLAPKETWADVMEQPGMMSVVVQGRRSDKSEGYTQVKVEPSTLLKTEFGVYVNTNEHFQLSEAYECPASALEAVSIINKRWDASMEHSEEIANRIVTLGEQ